MPFEDTIKKLNNFSKFLSNYKLWVDSITKEDLEWIVKTLQTRWKTTGEDATGDIIGTYSLVTSLINPEKVFGSPYTLDDTGANYRQMYANLTADAIITGSTSLSYTEMLEQPWFSEDIYNLNEAELDELAKRIASNAINNILNAWNNA